MTDEASTTRDELAAWCLFRLETLAAKDPMEWYPVWGWIADDGQPTGFAVERFGEEPTDKQIRLLAKALKWLHIEGRIETASCRRKSNGKGLVTPPLKTNVGYQFSSPRQSGGIHPWNSEYVVRLPRD